MAGARALVCMKHVGVNVAADPSSPPRTPASRADWCWSPPTTRHAQLPERAGQPQLRQVCEGPLIEPADSGEAKDPQDRLEMSERFDTPVLFRTTTRIAHSNSMVEPGNRPRCHRSPSSRRPPTKYTMLPATPSKRHPIVEQRLSISPNTPRPRPSTGWTWATPGWHHRQRRGVPIRREAFPKASFLKLGLTYPLSGRAHRRLPRARGRSSTWWRSSTRSWKSSSSSWASK